MLNIPCVLNRVHKLLQKYLGSRVDKDKLQGEVAGLLGYGGMRGANKQAASFMNEHFDGKVVG